MLGTKYNRFSQDQSFYQRHQMNEQQPKQKPKFRFHKNLSTSRYDEFLAESDDEEFFNSKPVTKDGREFDFDFKIDTYRDQIKLNKHLEGKGSQ